MRKKKMLPWRSIKSKENINGSTLSSQPGSSLSTWYRNINELPLYAFIRADVDDDLQALVITGSPTEKELEKAWADISGEYHDAIGDTKTIQRLFIFKELSLMALQLQGIYILIDGIKHRYHPFFHDELNKQLECDIQWDHTDIDAHFKAILRYHKRTGAIKRQIALKTVEYESMKQGAVGPKATRSYYESILITLSDFAKLPITDQISTFTYCERVRRLNEYVRKSKKK